MEAKDGLVLGRTAVPIDCLRNGLRAFDLLDAEHDPMMHARLLFDVKLTQIANIFGGFAFS